MSGTVQKPEKEDPPCQDLQSTLELKTRRSKEKSKSGTRAIAMQLQKLQETSPLLPLEEGSRGLSGWCVEAQGDVGTGFPNYGRTSSGRGKGPQMVSTGSCVAVFSAEMR